MTLVLAAVPSAAWAQSFDRVARGDRGSDVRLVQRALSSLGFDVEVDGVFGRATARAVRRYERREDLAVDGEVSRGQARGMLKRADMDTSDLDDAAARPRSVPTAGSATFPVQGAWKQGGGFGERGGGHDGSDLMADCGTPLVVAESGKVVFRGSHASAGNYVVIRSAASGEDHVYMHLQGTPAVGKGDAVEAGQRLGEVGRSGNASACHLHFETWTAPGWHEGGAPRDPAPDLRAWGGAS